jgi:exodeoxyribonuclease-5
MLNNFISSLIKKSLGFKPNHGQEKVIDSLALFVSPSSNEDEIFLLRGYAGTGKTSIVAGLVKAAEELNMKIVLLAPTGRAAKVLAYYSGHASFTVHKKIYRRKSSADGFGLFEIDVNLHTNTIFVVDEASMVSNFSSDKSVFGTGRLLDDLIKYVYNKKNCKLILSGDTAQLPPVGTSLSPALDKSYLLNYGKPIFEFELTEVVRQKSRSGILHNATLLRKRIGEQTKNPFEENKEYPQLTIDKFTDISRISGVDLIEKITEAYDFHGINDVTVICRSNKRANRYNAGIRSSILFREEELAKGDLLMIVKNNYFWTQTIPEIDFIANGDTAQVVKITGYSECYGYRFADVVLNFPDYDELEIETKILLDTLHLETAALTSEQNKDLFFKISEDFSEIGSKKKKYDNVREHPYFNALQVKYAYAVTCHKAQGGQWKRVFVDQGWLTEEHIDTEYLRWLYTAFTRAADRLELVNFNKEFFGEKD